MNRESVPPPRHLSYDFLREITNGFSEDRVLGSGTYGKVYRGVDKDGEKMAVKVLFDRESLDDDKLFEKEFYNLARFRHPNIVRFVGFCHETHRECFPYNGKMILADSTKRALCFEYMKNGSLDKFVSDEFSGHDWHIRYAIIKGICMGLKYLHQELEPPIFHLDLKPANVLLDENMVPRIADFGLSRLLEGERTRITASDIGTIGYLPPEYINQHVISNKLDIFSLGVVVIKIMTGPEGFSRSAEMSSQEFIDHVHANWRNRLQASSVDALDSYCKQVKRCMEIALSCVEPDRHKRPTIGDIIHELNETETINHFPDALRNDPGSSRGQESQECHITKVEEKCERKRLNDIGNLFGEVVDDYKLDQMARYTGRPKTQEDRAREALILVNDDNKDINASRYVDSLISLDGMPKGTRCLVYNATGDTIYYVTNHNWLGYIGSAPYPTEIGNGQWAAFRHAQSWTSTGSMAAVVYRGKSKDGEDEDYLLAWSVMWMQSRPGYCEPLRNSVGSNEYTPLLGPGPGPFHLSPSPRYGPTWTNSEIPNFLAPPLRGNLSSPTWCKDYMPLFVPPAPRPSYLLPSPRNSLMSPLISSAPLSSHIYNVGSGGHRPLLGLGPGPSNLVHPNKAYCDIGVVNYFQTRMADVYCKLVLSNYSSIAKSDSCEIEATIGEGQLPKYTAIIKSRR